MNTHDDRFTIPPPDCCRTCENCETWRGSTGIVRHRCRPGHPMHPGCTWHKPRRQGLITERGKT